MKILHLVQYVTWLLASGPSPPPTETWALIPDNLFIQRKLTVMAAPAEHLLSLGHRTSDKNTLPKQQQQGVKTR